LTDLGESIPCAFVGTWGEGKPVIGFLGEFDALSGLSQKPAAPAGSHCARRKRARLLSSLLGSGALAAAVALRDYVKENHLACTIQYFGCPGEEGGSGKAFMARQGVFQALDAAITWHGSAMTQTSVGSTLANIQVYYKFTPGFPCRASPH